METLLYYVWKYKLYAPAFLVTTKGLEIEIIDPGVYNVDSGPDFFNAKIKIAGKLWAGNVEIHQASSDWFSHHHETNKAYNSVILHVVENVDLDDVFDEQGRSIPQVQLTIPEQIKLHYDYMLSRDSTVPCLGRILEISTVYLSDWKNALMLERLERKTQTFHNLLDDYSGDWNEVFYITLSRNFGFGINNDAFERLARSLPLKYIKKHQDSFLQVEALFFGQAGLLEGEFPGNDYFLSLKKEYGFLRKKYELQPLEEGLFKSLRIRPDNFPHIKIAQLASFVREQQFLFSKIIEAEKLPELQQLFVLDLPEYWLTHYHFGKQSIKRNKLLGLSAVHIILINTVIPLLLAFGKKKQQPELVDRAVCFLESIPPECNSIVGAFRRAGVIVEHAGDSQALIQLKREYCERKKCIFCRIGHKLLSKQQIV